MRTISSTSLAMLSSLAALLAGCSSGGPGNSVATTSEALSSSIDPDNLMSDGDLTGCTSITASQVQKFLSSRGSALASYSSGGQSAADIIASQSDSHGVSPIYMVARIETESGLISSGNLDYLDSATGCGCPDTGGCDPSLSGFAAQINCAAVTIKGYLSDLSSSGETVSGWAVGRAKDTSDPCDVTPANAATAALYTYTPWVGAYSTWGCGDKAYGGSSLVASLYEEYKGDFSACSGGSSPPPPPPPPGKSCTLDGHSYATNTCTETLQCDDGKWIARTSDPSSCKTGVESGGACITDSGSVVAQNTCTSTLQCDDGVWVDREDDPAACDCDLAGHSYAANTCTETLQCDDGEWVARTSDPSSCNTGIEPSGACLTDSGSVAAENTCTSTLQCDDGVWIDREDDPADCR
jgi:hypothetical protein